MWVFCESHQGKKARPSGPPGGASLLVNRNDVRPRYAGPKDDAAALRSWDADMVDDVCRATSEKNNCMNWPAVTDKNA